MHSMKRLAFGAGLMALSAAMASAAFAQETASSLRGTVTSNGAPVANASVTVVHTPSGTRSTTVSDNGGVFDARGLRVGGPYTVTVTAPGQPAKSFTDIYLTLAQTFDLPVELTIQEVEAIEITATRNAETGTSTVLNRDTIASVVSVTRDIRDLARRDPLASQNLGGAGGIAIAGSNPRTNRITIDGVTAQDPYGLDAGGMPTSRGPVMLDSIEQFSIAAAPTDVENGSFSGGAINMVLRSGTNQYHGSLFVNYLNEGLVGRHIGASRVPQVISQKNFGATLTGPIWQDKLFFALAYETYETSGTNPNGPAGEGYTNSYLNGLSRATLDSITNTFNNNYASDYDNLGLLKGYPIFDKKYSAKLDWNITDQHRASLTYRYAESGGTATGGNTQTIAAFYSNLYNERNIDQASTFELNSDWTDRFSTTFRATYRDWERGQNPPSGQNFSEFTICAQPNPDAALTDANQFSCAGTFSQVRFGPDFSRHANRLNIEEANFSFVGRYTLGDNSFKFGYQGAHKDVYNVFIGGARGTYYFDSLADFQAGRANQFQYFNATTGNPSDAAAQFDYWVHSFFGQDTLQVTDTFKITAGARFDYITVNGEVGANPNFKNRNGFTNSKNVDGLYTLMPRISAEWKPTPDLKFTAGFGLFSGGYPEVMFANPYSNTGYQTSGIVIRRLANGTFTETSNTPGFTQAIGATALDNLRTNSTLGYVIPASLQQLQSGALSPGGPAVPATNAVLALAPTFELPGEWKASLNAQWRVWDGWNLTLDYVSTQTNNGISYRDFRAQPLIVNGVRAVTPDGRPRYDALTATAAQRAAQGISSVSPSSTNFDLVGTNKDKGEAWTAAVGVSKSFDFGLDFALSYARQRVNELNGGALRGTTTSSLYQTVPAGFDAAEDAYGRATGEVQDFSKLELGYRKKFFGDNETRITLFGERYSGRAFGFAMNDTATSGRNTTFGTARFNYLLYVPDITGDSNTADLNVGSVTFATAGDRDRFLGYVKQFNLANNRILEKNTNTNKDVNRLDLQISQEFPSLFEGHKFKVQVDVKNLLNLIDRDWGKVSEYGTGGTGGGGEIIARAQCADAAGVAVAATSAVCSRYLYTNVPATVNRFTNTIASLWYAQVTLKYEF